MKWLIRIALVVVLLIVVAVGAGALMIDSIATAAVQKGAAFATQTDVECAGVDVHIFGAAADIEGLDIKNPDGPFREKFDSFLVLGNGSAEVSAATVMSNLVEIPRVELSDITISLVGIDGATNYETILEALKRFQGEAPPQEEEGGKQFVIREVVISRITVVYDFDADPVLGAAPASGEVKIAFDEPIILQNVGQGGVPMAQITADLITDVLVQVTANMAGDIGGHMQGLTSALVDTLTEAKFLETFKELELDPSVLGDLGVDFSEGALEAFGGVGEIGGDILNGGADGIGGAIDGVFGGRRNRDNDN